jgi:hypothetical protein
MEGKSKNQKKFGNPNINLLDSFDINIHDAVELSLPTIFGINTKPAIIHSYR